MGKYLCKVFDDNTVEVSYEETKGQETKILTGAWDQTQYSTPMEHCRQAARNHYQANRPVEIVEEATLTAKDLK